jgi:surfeit locus 1 family protein
MHMPPEKHLSYSVQWFALALAVVIVYLVVNIKKKA